MWPLRQGVWWVLGALAMLALAACREELRSAAEVNPKLGSIIGGEIADSCTWPTAVSVNTWGACSGTLIHPRVVTTAAHCLSGQTAQILFGASRVSPGAFSLTARCRAGAQANGGSGTSRDWAYCVLPEDERVKRLPITPPLTGCEADKYLREGAPAWIVGYGVTGPDGVGAGIKRHVETTIHAIDVAGETLEIGDAESSACFGDSGGPAFLRIASGGRDWGFRVIGATTGGSTMRCNCNCSAIFVNIAVHVREIEANENIDVTPCTDADGRWDPSEACDELPLAPQLGTGIFPLCNVQRTTEPIRSCEEVDPAAGGGGGTAAGSGGAPAAGSVAEGGAGGAVAEGGAGGAVAEGGAGGAGAAGGAGGSGRWGWWWWPWWLPTAGSGGSGAGGSAASGGRGGAAAGAEAAGAGAGAHAAGNGEPRPRTSPTIPATDAGAPEGDGGRELPDPPSSGASGMAGSKVPPAGAAGEVARPGEAGTPIRPSLAIPRVRSQSRSLCQAGPPGAQAAGAGSLALALVLASALWITARTRSRRR